MLISKLFLTITKFAIRKLAQNPEIQTKAAKVVEERFVPGLKEGWKCAEPKLRQAQKSAVDAKNDVAAVAKEINPHKNPKQFVSKAAERLRDRARR